MNLDKSSAEQVPCFISCDATRAVLDWPDVIAAMRKAYSVPHTEICNPPRTVARGDQSWIRTLTAAPPTSRFMGAKIFGAGPQWKVNYAIVLVEQATGLIFGIIDSAHITAMRTAATSSLAVDRLVPAKTVSLGVLGSSVEAQSHIAAIASLRTISELKVYSPTQASRDACIEHIAATCGIIGEAVDSAEKAVLGADVIVAAARSRGELPILFGSWLNPGSMVVSIGSTLPEQREIDTSVVAACDLIVCDAVDEVVTETGDMIAASAAGIDYANKIVSLNELLLGACDERVKLARLPMFKSTGSGIQDIIVAELAFDAAVKKGLAQAMPGHFFTKT